MYKASSSNTSSHVGEIPDVFPIFSEPVLLRIVEYGGFVAAMLALCLFFKVLTGFVQGVKED